MKPVTKNSTRLENFPVSFFAMVMGLSGLTIGWEKAQHILGVDLHINSLLVGITASVFVGLALIYSTKLIRYRPSVMQELKHPIKLNFFPSISISMLLLSICFLPINMAITHQYRDAVLDYFDDHPLQPGIVSSSD